MQLSDYQNIRNYKESHSVIAQENLYKKYLPLINKVSNKYAHLDSFEDRQQEAYFILCKTLNYCNIDKMNENFSFGYFFKMKLIQDFNLEISKKKDEISLNSLVGDDDATEFQDIIYYYKTFSNISFEQDIDFNMLFQNFKESLSDKEQELLQALKQNKNAVEIAKQFKTSKSWVYHIISKLKNKYAQYMNFHGYDIKLN